MYSKDQECFFCMDSCLSCITSDECLKCMPFSYLQAETKTCQPCISDCYICHDGLSCQSCSEGYVVDDNTKQCVKFDPQAAQGQAGFGSAEQGNTANEVVILVESTSNTASSSSEALKQTYFAEDVEMKVTIDGCWKMRSVSECMYCLNGFFKSGKICETCDVNCSKCFSRDNCLRCSLGFVLTQISANQATCSKHQVAIYRKGYSVYN